MSLKFLEENVFGASEIFAIQREETSAIFVTTRRMEDFEKYGIELHYEVHYSEGKDNFVRLDCHVAPYGKYKNCSKEEYKQRIVKEYGTQQTNKILRFRSELKETFLKLGKNSTDDSLHYGEYNKYNYWYIVTMDLPNSCSGEQLRQSVEWFISKTRPHLEKALDKLEIILQ